MNSHCKGPRGFTLVELLVVIGIIAVLIGILLPTLSQARASAKKVECLSNQRQIGTLMVMYINGNDGRMPVTHYKSGGNQGNWIQFDFGLPEVYDNWDFMQNISNPGMNFFGGLIRMEEGIIPALICGEAEIWDPQGVLPEDQPVTNYLVNGNFPNRKIVRVPDSAQYAVLQDNRTAFQNSYLRPGRGVAQAPSGAPYADALTGPFTARDRYAQWAHIPGGVNAPPDVIAAYGNVHDGGGVFLMADGHGEWIKKEATTARVFGLTGPDPTRAWINGRSTDRYEESLTKWYLSLFDFDEPNPTLPNN